MIDLNQTRREVRERCWHFATLELDVKAKPKQDVVVGAVFTDWTVLSEPYSITNDLGRSRKHSDCRCKCGIVKPVITSSLKNGQAKRCPKCVQAMNAAKRLSLTKYKPVKKGDTFGEWTAVSEPYPLSRSCGRPVRHVDCQCGCGFRKAIREWQLQRGGSSGCRKCANKVSRSHIGKRAKA